MISKKIVLIGDFSAGKTSVVRRFVDNSFSDNYLTTIGVKISTKVISTNDKSLVRAIIWDIEGGTQNQPINETYLTGAHGAVVVADVTNKESIANLHYYLKTVKEITPSVGTVVALNKTDLISSEKVEEIRRATAMDLLMEDGDVFSVSAKTGEGVSTMFKKLASKITES